MFQRIKLENFKLHESTEIEAAPITVFIGPNNSGKSSIFQALLTLRQAATAPDMNLCRSTQRQHTSAEQPYLFPTKQLIDIGEFGNIVRRGHKEISLSVKGTVDDGGQGKYGGPLDIEFEVLVRNNVPVYHKGRLKSSYGEIPWNWSTGQPSQTHSIQIKGAILHFQAAPDFRLLLSSGMTLPPNFPAGESADIQVLRNYLGRATVLLLNSAHPIFPLRGFEEWGYQLPDSRAESLERLTLADRNIAIASILAYDRELEEKLSHWLEDLLHVGIRIKLVPPKRVTIWSKPSSARDSDTLFSNEGTGANQIPFILVPIGLTPPNETILLSEPEAHLHPKAQSELASLLLKIATKENRQFFIETHSEHILHALLHAVATGTLEKDSLAIYYFVNRNGTADVTRLQLDDKGRIEGGLPGFFEHSLTELSEYLDAIKNP